MDPTEEDAAEQGKEEEAGGCEEHSSFLAVLPTKRSKKIEWKVQKGQKQRSLELEGQVK
jgi:hypothetical protein